MQRARIDCARRIRYFRPTEVVTLTGDAYKGKNRRLDPRSLRLVNNAEFKELTTTSESSQKLFTAIRVYFLKFAGATGELTLDSQSNGVRAQFPLARRLSFF